MICIACGGKTEVINSRPAENALTVWRRRRCSSCHKMFSTREKPDLSRSVRVKKDGNQEEPFSEDKLFLSVHECLSHQKDALEASRALSDTIMQQVLLGDTTTVIESQKIADITYRVLERFDKAGAVYYRAHHKIDA
jgi:transcriptional repressor NrdR